MKRLQIENDRLRSKLDKKDDELEEYRKSVFSQGININQYQWKDRGITS